MSGPVKVDVLVVGSGAAGLSAAVTAAVHGASVMVAEKASVLGGTSAWSGGWLWIPCNPLARAEGIDEAADAPLTYLQHEMGGEAADVRLQTFLHYGPEMVDFFHQRTAVKFLSGSTMPDFHASPGAANGGRSVTAQPYDGRLLGDWLHRLRPPLETISLAGMGIAGGADMAHFFNATRSPRSALYAARRLLRHGWQRLRAGRGLHLVNGNALVARLLRSALDAGVRFQLNAPAVRLLQGPQGVSGAVLRSDGGEILVEAGAVVLACGGFPHDRQRLAQVVPHAAEGYGHFSAAPPDNQGEGIRIVNMQFAHGFHNQAVELQAESTRWRVTPKFAGPSYVLGDLATHPLFVAETMAPQLNIKRLMCSRQSFVPSRAPLEDNAFVLMEYDNGAVGSMWTSAVNSGAMHSQKVRIVGEKASIEWWDEHPNQLSYEVQGEPARILERGMPYLSANALADDRIGGGHPEGLFEAWANLYRRYAQAIDATDRDDRAFLQDFWYPDVEAGLHGVYWVEQCVKSADAGSQWVDFTLP